MDKKKLVKLQRAEDYALQIQTSNSFKPLVDFPPLSYSQAAQPIQISSSIPSNTETQKSSYVTKSHFDHLTLTRFNEPKDVKTLQNIMQRLYPHSCHWPTDNNLKTQRYYEYILVDSGSVEIVHTPNPKNPTHIAYSKCIIKNIQKPEEWTFPFNEKTFSKPFNPKGYNYYDYQIAWTRMLLKRPFDHSWFFTFHSSFSKNFPLWFLEWWQYFGPVTEILPPEANMGYLHYIRHAPGDAFERTVKFYAEFKVPWIFCWQYEFAQHFPKPNPVSIIRKYKVKWWPSFKTKYCSQTNVQTFLTTGEKIKWEKPNTTPGPSTSYKQKTSVKTEQNPSNFLSEKDFKILQMLSDQSPELAQNYIQMLSATMSPQGSNKVESEGSSSDPFGGPNAQDPFEF